MAAVGRSRALRQAIATHPVAAFLVILHTLTWIFNLPAQLGKSGFGVFNASPDGRPPLEAARG